MTYRTPTLLVSLVLASALVLGCGDPVADHRLSISMAVESVNPPVVGTRGGEAVTLIGRNLSGATGLRVGGQPAMIVAQEDAHLIFVAPPNRPGKQSIVLEGPAGNTTPESALAYRVERPSFAREHVLAPTFTFPAANQASLLRHFEVADFDGDGVSDLVVLRTGSFEWHASRDGQVHRQTFDQDPLASSGIAGAGDLDGDGRADLVTYVSPQWRVWWSDPAGGPLRDEPLSVLADVPDSPSAHQDIRLGNFEPGGGLELASLNPSLTIWRLRPGTPPQMLRARSDIRYDSRQRREPYFEGIPRPVAEDLDRDGLTDLVYVLDDGLVHAARAPEFASGEWTGLADQDLRWDYQLVVGDVTGDDLPDIVLHRSFARGRGDGTFDEAVGFETVCDSMDGLGNVILYAGPFPRGDRDRMTVALCPGKLKVHRWQNGQLVSRTQEPFTSPIFQTPAHRVVEIDGDGLLDVVYQSDAGVIARHGVFEKPEHGFRHEATFSTLQPLPVDSEQPRPVEDTGLMAPGPSDRLFSEVPPRVALGNFGTARPLAGWFGKKVTLLERRGRNLRAAADLILPERVDALAGCDLDRDGRDELIAVTDKKTSLVAIQVTATGLEGPRPLAKLDAHRLTTVVISGDLDRDGRCDIAVVGDRFARPVNPPQLFLSRDGGTVQRLEFVPTGSVNFSGLGGVDFDGDGDLDLYSHTSQVVLRNQGGGHFTSEELGLLGAGATVGGIPLRWLELERSGNTLTAYLLAARFGEPKVVAGVARRQDGAAWSPLRATYAVLPRRTTDHLLVGDVDGDGQKDVVLPQVPANRDDPLASELEMSLLVFRATSDGGLAVPILIPIAPPVQTVAEYSETIGRLFDVDADGLDDLLLSYPAFMPVWVVHNDSE
jgi:hypothetical protein